MLHSKLEDVLVKCKHTLLKSSYIPISSRLKQKIKGNILFPLLFNKLKYSCSFKLDYENFVRRTVIMLVNNEEF